MHLVNDQRDDPHPGGAHRAKERRLLLGGRADGLGNPGQPAASTAAMTGYRLEFRQVLRRAGWKTGVQTRR